MSVDAAVLRRLSELRLPSEAMAEVLSIIADIQASSDEKAAKHRAAQAKYMKTKRSADISVKSQRYQRDITPRAHYAPPRDAPTPEPARGEYKPLPLEIAGTEKKEGKKDKSPSPYGDFERWWKAYPRHEAKGAARKAFDKLDPKAIPFERLMEATERYRSSGPDPKFTPHPATWLNAERWLDEPPTAKPTNPMSQAFADLRARVNGREADGWPGGQPEFDLAPDLDPGGADRRQRTLALLRAV